MTTACDGNFDLQALTARGNDRRALLPGERAQRMEEPRIAAHTTFANIRRALADRVVDLSKRDPRALQSELGRLFLYIWALADRHGVDWFAAARSVVALDEASNR